MSNNIKNFINQTYEIFKRDFWILVAVNIAASLILNFTLEFHPGIVFLAVSILFFKNLSFVRGASIMPSVSSDFDRFSWKYYMGMPLNKYELILSLVITNIIVMVPLFTWAACFFPQLLQMIESDPSKLKVVTVIKGSLLILAFFCFTSLKSVHQQVTNPRKKYSKVSSKVLFLQRLRKFLIVLTIGVYVIVGMEYVEVHTGVKLDFLFKWVEPTFSFIFKTWFLIPAVFAAVVGFYYVLIYDWQNEKRGYIKPDWKPKRDGSIITACMSALILPFFIFDLEIPYQYGNSDLNRAVYYKEYKKVLKLIANGHDINKASEFGYSPALVAAREGDLSMLKVLVQKGAVLTGKISKKDGFWYGKNALHLAIKSQKNDLVKFVINKHPEFVHMPDQSGDYPIHTAARNCRTDVMDTLISVSLNPNVKNSAGESPLHLAVQSGCFASVSMLLEVGSDVNAKDNANKLAADFIDASYKIDRDEAYILKKKLRAPASQK